MVLWSKLSYAQKRKVSRWFADVGGKVTALGGDDSKLRLIGKINGRDVSGIHSRYCHVIREAYNRAHPGSEV